MLLSEMKKNRNTLKRSTLLNKEYNDIPIKDKFLLTLAEASKYFGIGQNKIRELIKEPECNYVLYNGNKTLIKRQAMESYLSREFSI